LFLEVKTDHDAKSFAKSAVSGLTF